MNVELTLVEQITSEDQTVIIKDGAESGYLSLSPDWLAKNPVFKLTIPLIPRLISPHPYTNQNTISIARGPIIYCVEDFDNSWVQDHFKVCTFPCQKGIAVSDIETERSNP